MYQYNSPGEWSDLSRRHHSTYLVVISTLEGTHDDRIAHYTGQCLWSVCFEFGHRVAGLPTMSSRDREVTDRCY